ncbi:hypothetical protein MBAV_000114 [Candidatus Magnetobacterium bavaricum]|uniref:Uncharacterized protein n=1 Tax=Candidatus Magnetobacterium bavaricum TaxID=29290 RepID=A0A0F3H0E7_9BACT|nr:hypothetical protein MBAV_000114 [Candidatus Magnetobacterium bavaricum]
MSITLLYGCMNHNIRKISRPWSPVYFLLFRYLHCCTILRFFATSREIEIATFWRIITSKGQRVRVAVLKKLALHCV